MNKPQKGSTFHHRRHAPDILQKFKTGSDFKMGRQTVCYIDYYAVKYLITNFYTLTLLSFSIDQKGKLTLFLECTSDNCTINIPLPVGGYTKFVPHFSLAQISKKFRQNQRILSKDIPNSSDLLYPQISFYPRTISNKQDDLESDI